MTDGIYIESVELSPNPVAVGGTFTIAVEIYTLFPDAELYPALDLYPGADLFTLCPEEALYPGTDLYPTEGGMDT